MLRVRPTWSSSVLPYEEFEKAVREIFANKGEEVVETNIKALALGREQAK